MSRDITALARECGLTVDRVDVNGRHYKLYVAAADGRRAMFTMPRSASDHRAMLNKRAQLRAFAENRHAGADRSGRQAPRNVGGA